MIRSLTYLDRYRNKNTRTYSKHSEYTEAAPKYQPSSENKSFTLKSYRVSRNHLKIYQAFPPDHLTSFYLDEDSALFCIHPQVLEAFPHDPYIRKVREEGRSGPEILVSPSSSTRTLYCEEPLPHAVKVHFPFRISRYGRKMRDEVIEQAINVSREMEENIELFDSSFGYLREVIGIAYTNLDTASERGENWGYLVRDMHPFPAASENRMLIPGFALYGKDFFDDSTPFLLHEILDLTGADPLEYVLDSIMLPIVKHWITCFRSFGFMLEPHGQNVLLELDKNYRVTRIVHRDLSLGIDMRLRRDMGVSSDHLNSYNRMEYGDFSSITYDMFMGNHFFERAVACCQQHSAHLKAEDFRNPCRELFARAFPEHKKYLPDTVRYFSEVRDRYNKPLYLDTKMKPKWRP